MWTKQLVFYWGFLLALISGVQVMEAQRSYPLKKIGTFTDEAVLHTLYALHARPLIIINSTVYLPDDRCINIRRYGGSYVIKDLGGNWITKSEGGDESDKGFDAAEDNKQLEADGEEKQLEAEIDTKSKAAQVDLKMQTGEVGLREEDGEIDERTATGSNDSKETEGTESEKAMDGDLVARMASASRDEKKYGGTTLYIKCREDDAVFDLVDFFGKGLIQLFDINGLRQVNSVDILYEE